MVGMRVVVVYLLPCSQWVLTLPPRPTPRPRPERLLSTNASSMQVWSLPSQKFVCTLTGHNNWVRCATFRCVTVGGVREG